MRYSLHVGTPGREDAAAETKAGEQAQPAAEKPIEKAAERPIERRAEPRVERRDERVLRLRCPTWTHFDQLYAGNVRQGHMFVPRQPGSPTPGPIVIAVALPTGAEIRLPARVMGVDGSDPELSRIKIRFDARSEADERAIEETITSARSATRSRFDRAGRTTARSVPEPSSAPEPREPAAAPKPAAKPAKSAQEEQAIAKLREDIARLQGAADHEALGVAADLRGDPLQRAYIQQCRKFHPDRFAKYQSAEVQELAHQAFVLIEAAYRRLSRAAPPAKEEAPRASKATPPEGAVIEEARPQPPPVAPRSAELRSTQPTPVMPAARPAQPTPPAPRAPEVRVTQVTPPSPPPPTRPAQPTPSFSVPPARDLGPNSRGPVEPLIARAPRVTPAVQEPPASVDPRASARTISIPPGDPIASSKPSLAPPSAPPPADPRTLDEAQARAKQLWQKAQKLIDEHRREEAIAVLEQLLKLEPGHPLAPVALKSLRAAESESGSVSRLLGRVFGLKK